MGFSLYQLQVLNPVSAAAILKFPHVVRHDGCSFAVQPTSGKASFFPGFNPVRYGCVGAYWFTAAQVEIPGLRLVRQDGCMSCQPVVAVNVLGRCVKALQASRTSRLVRQLDIQTVATSPQQRSMRLCDVEQIGRARGAERHARSNHYGLSSTGQSQPTGRLQRHLRHLRHVNHIVAQHGVDAPHQRQASRRGVMPMMRARGRSRAIRCADAPELV